jgi:hypothetical protein
MMILLIDRVHALNDFLLRAMVNIVIVFSIDPHR